MTAKQGSARIAGSALPADFARLREECQKAAARRLIDGAQHPIELEVDGGIGLATAVGAVATGADVICGGSALFSHPRGHGAAVTELRAAEEGNR